MDIKLPQVGESVTEGVIGKWLKLVGERVEKFDPLVEVVTDKVNMEMPSPVSGVLTAIVAKEGDTVPMGELIAQIEADENPQSLKKTEPPCLDEQQLNERSSVSRTGELLKNVPSVGPTGGILRIDSPPPTETVLKRYSPAVMRLADKHNIDLTQIEGSGINGRITRKDIQNVIDRNDLSESTLSTSIKAEERIKITPIRRLIADNMIKSAMQIPQAWTIAEVNVSRLIEHRQNLRKEFQRREGINITYLPFIIEIVAQALKENPLLNSSWDTDSIILKTRINIGVAMATPNGLMVPVIHDANTLSVSELAKRIHDLTDRSRRDQLRLEDVQGGTFTVNNTGVLGSIASKPLINPPQAAIMTTEAIVKKPVIINDGIAIRSMMNLCLSFDHRIMDGSEASKFIDYVKSRLESPSFPLP